MKPRSAVAGFVVASFLFAGTAVAQSTSHFRFGGMRFEVPVPAGYCLPRGQEIDVAQIIAAADDRNVTHLTLYACDESDGPRRDYILFKTPTEVMTTTVTREQFLDALGDAVDRGVLSSGLSGETIGQIENRLSSMIGSGVDLTGNVRVLGRDDVCAYLGGTMQLAGAGTSYSISVGACLTVISNRVLTINWYGPDRGSVGIAELLVRSRRLAEAITTSPAD